MLDRIRQLGADAVIYGLSTILGRFLSFLLVPFYTNVLLPGEYGIIAYLYSLIAFANVLYSYGMESAFFKYSSTLEIGTSRQNFSTPFLSLIGTSVFFSFLLLIWVGPAALMIGLPVQYERILLYSAGILACDAIAIVPFATLRLERKARRFATIKFLNIVINVLANIYLLLEMHLGVEGVFLGGFISSAMTLVLLGPTIKRHFSREFHPPLLAALLRFALPIIPSGLAAMAMQIIDRPILRALTDDATVGIYQANYRLGIFMMLVVSIYDYAWRPFYFSIAKEPNAKQIFARVLTYLVLIMAAIFLTLTLFIEPIVTMNIFGRHLIHPDYWSGLEIVPVVLLGYVFLGIATNLSAGLYIEKKTALVPIGTFVGAAVNILSNLLLIPYMGMLGAAWATLLAYLAMAIAVYVVVQRVYPVDYEVGRLVKIAIAVAVVLILFWYVPINGSPLTWLFKIGLLGLFGMLMYQMKFFDGAEHGLIKAILRRRPVANSQSDAPGYGE